jgi:hypothetical protein
MTKAKYQYYKGIAVANLLWVILFILPIFTLFEMRELALYIVLAENSLMLFIGLIYLVLCIKESK